MTALSMPFVRFRPEILRTALLALFALSGCSTGWNHRYDTLAPQIEARGFGKVVVVTRDERPYVLSGEHRPQYAGLVNGMYGKPWEILTASGKPLAQDVSNAVCNALIGKGFECLPLMSSQSDLNAEIEYLLNTHSPVRILYLKIDDWQSEVYTGTELTYDLALDVWNRRAHVMASVRVKGKDSLPTVAMFNPAENASIVVPQAMERYLGMLLNNEKIMPALAMVKEIDVLGANYRD